MKKRRIADHFLFMATHKDMAVPVTTTDVHEAHKLRAPLQSVIRRKALEAAADEWLKKKPKGRRK